ncbi:hypothetical protein MAR_001021 [Mya arenaria]|uniref:Uncharacterized protein n=1 Tax=Mya arenaria TaxID=6604 RepID=A0ABY7FAI9_MYAAR|nr:hypothetical protein MAR_001021 [Mya arenaria]
MKTRQESNRRKLKRPKPTEEDTLNTSSAAKETVIKTPQIKTPRGVRRNAVRTTPGRDEIVFSQNFDSQAVVGWDCNSPLNVGRVHRGGDGQDVSDLLKLIADEDEGSLPQGNTPPLLGAWKVGASKEDGTTEDNNNEHCAEADNELEDVTEDAETEPINDNRVVLNVSGDLFDTTKVEKPSVGNAPVKTENHWANKVPVRVSPRLQKKIEVKTGTNVISPIDANFENVVQGASKISTDVLNCAQTDVNEDDWSDDELFEEDSFIIKATQIPGEEKNFNSPVFGIKRKSSNATDLPKNPMVAFSEDLFGDDDMLGDDGLTEPEIMAMLDEVEFQATQQLSQKRTSTESVKSLTGSQESTLRLQPQAVKPSETSLPNSPAETIQPSSQGSNGNSPAKNSQTKYSPEEIERKKQLALQKRRLKIHK